MSTPMLIMWIVLALIGIMGSALCSGLEVGLYTVSRVLIRVRAVDQPKAAKLKKQIDDPAPVLTTLLVYNNGFNYLATLALTALLSTTGLSDTLIMVIQAAVLTPILLIFAESIPKELFRSRANTLMERLANLITSMSWTLTIIPITPIITSVTKLIAPDLSGTVRSARQHMADLIKHADDQITQSQSDMIDRALLLNQTPVRTAMVPLARVLRVSTTSTRKDALAMIKKSNHTRYPVHDATGHITGCIQTIDLYSDQDAPLGDLIEPILRINTEVPMRQVLAQMNAKGIHMAVVTRSGQDAGLITRKDLLSPLIATTHDW